MSYKEFIGVVITNVEGKEISPYLTKDVCG